MAVAIGEEQGLRGIFIYFSFACLPFFLASIFFWSWPCAMTRAVLRPLYSLSSLLWLSWGRRFPGNCSEYDVHRRIQGLPALPPFPLLGIIYFFIGVFRGIENILLDSTRLSDFNYPFFFHFPRHSFLPLSSISLFRSLHFRTMSRPHHSVSANAHCVRTSPVLFPFLRPLGGTTRCPEGSLLAL